MVLFQNNLLKLLPARWKLILDINKTVDFCVGKGASNKHDFNKMNF